MSGWKQARTPGEQPIPDPLAGAISGKDLMSQNFPDLSAGDLVDFGQCSGACMVAPGPVEDCECACNGYYHGQARDAVVRGYEENLRVRSASQAAQACLTPGEDMPDVHRVALLSPPARSVQDVATRLRWRKQRAATVLREFRNIASLYENIEEDA